MGDAFGVTCTKNDALFEASGPNFYNAGMIGVPITCVLLLHDGLIYGQGPWLRCDRNSSVHVFPNGGVIHGISIVDMHTDDGTCSLVVHGGNQIAVVSLLKQDDETPIIWNVHSKCTVKDWIWTISCRKALPREILPRIYVGLAHNSVDVFELDSMLELRRISSVQGFTRSITYSMAMLIESSEDTSSLVACGTVLNTVLVWNLQQQGGCTESGFPTKDSEHHLVGHKGAIHRVCFHSNTVLASIAEDRAVKLWSYGASAWSLRWTGWGHTSRGWNVGFSPCLHDDDSSTECVLSTGEDGTLRIWNLTTGKSLATLRGHGSCKQCIWGLSCCGSIVATGANDGSVVTHDISSLFPGCSNMKNTSDLSSFDRLIELENTRGDAVFDMHFVSAKNKHFGRGPTLVLASRDGGLQSLDISYGSAKSKQLRPWNDLGENGCSLQVHPTEAIVAVGLKSGDVIVRKASTESSDELLLDGKEQRSAQKLVWLNEHQLMSFHVTQGTAVMWSLSFESSWETKGKRLLVSNSNGLVNCCATEDDRIIVGDTRGHISLHHGDSSFVLRRVHGREHVTQVYWENSEAILSAGNDGFIARCQVTKENELIKLISIPVAGITGLTNIWVNSNGVTTVGGYQANRFCVLDIESGYEHLGVDTGGRQRMLAAHCTLLGPNQDSAYVVAIRASAKDDFESIRVCVSVDKRTTESMHGSIIKPLHSETIFDVKGFYALGKLHLISGSEDCSVKISSLRPPFGSHFPSQGYKHSSPTTNCVSTKSFPPHSSGIRTVCCHALGNGTTLVVTASKIVLDFFLLDDDSSQIFYQGSAKPSSENTTIDQRANSIGISDLSEGNGVLVVVGGSDGICYATVLFPAWGFVKPVSLSVVYQNPRPILALDVFTVKEDLIVVLGTSGGEAILINIGSPEFELGGGAKFKSTFVILQYRPHSLGLNSLQIRLNKETMERTTIQILSCGDDQAIHIATVVLENVGGEMRALLEDKRFVENASRSALKGLRLLDGNHFVTVGYANCLAVWNYSEKSIRKVKELPVSVGDVNSLSSVEIKGEEKPSYVIAVGGSGVETFCFQN